MTLAVSWDLLALSGLAGLAAALAVFALGCLLLAVVLAGWWVARHLRRRLVILRDPMYYGPTR